jgi:hypothetical protein
MTNPQSDVLNSWKEVSNYIGRGVRTVQRWEKDFGLPVRRPSGHLRGSVIALKTDIDGWLSSRQAREAQQAAPEAPEKKAVHPVTKERYDRLHDNADKLMKNCSLLKTSAEELEANVRRIERSRAKWRAANKADDGASAS